MEDSVLAEFIRDWFLKHEGHYAGWSELEADIDMTVDFLALARAINEAKGAHNGSTQHG